MQNVEDVHPEWLSPVFTGAEESHASQDILAEPRHCACETRSKNDMCLAEVFSPVDAEMLGDQPRISVRAALVRQLFEAQSTAVPLLPLCRSKTFRKDAWVDAVRWQACMGHDC